MPPSAADVPQTSDAPAASSASDVSEVSDTSLAPHVPALPTANPPEGAEPALLAIVPVLATPDGVRCVLIRTTPDAPLTLLRIEAPRGETLRAVLEPLIQQQLGLTLAADPVPVTAAPIPVRTLVPRAGAATVGWLRAVRVPVAGVLAPDIRLSDAQALTPDAARDALTTDRERALLRVALDA